MVRISAFLIAACMVLIAALLGAVVYARFGFTGAESALAGLGALTAFAVYYAVAARRLDRLETSNQLAKLARGAGMSVQLVAKEGGFATLRLPSTEMRRVPIDCRATLGTVGNPEAELIKVGKAGRNRWKGIRPQTRGVAMNPVDHPLGGGEGKSSGGRHPVSPWGKPEGRTRKKGKASDKLIIRRRRTRGARR